MGRLNVFENLPVIHQNAARQQSIGTLFLQGVYIPGSISFNNVFAIRSVSGTTAKTFSFFFGLYSLNGSTLSLANSALHTGNPASNALSYISFTTSATQDITPGNWWFGYLLSTSGNSRMSLMCHFMQGSRGATQGYGGMFINGFYGTSTGGLPASIATSDCVKENTTTTTLEVYPYVIISA